MIEKTKNLLNSKYIKSLQDIRNVGLIIFVIIVLLGTWSAVGVVQTNYGLQKRISVMKQQNDVSRIENSNIALKNKYLETDEYLELVARKQFNKALPGETMVIVPRAVAMKHSTDLGDASSSTPIRSDMRQSGSKFERNFNEWLDFLFRRQ